MQSGDRVSCSATCPRAGERGGGVGGQLGFSHWPCRGALSSAGPCRSPPRAPSPWASALDRWERLCLPGGIWQRPNTLGAVSLFPAPVSARAWPGLEDNSRLAGTPCRARWPPGRVAPVGHSEVEGSFPQPLQTEGKGMAVLRPRGTPRDLTAAHSVPGSPAHGHRAGLLAWGGASLFVSSAGPREGPCHP